MTLPLAARGSGRRPRHAHLAPIDLRDLRQRRRRDRARRRLRSLAPGQKAQAVKARYVGVCRGCGAYTQPRKARATPTPTASAATRVRSSGARPSSGCSRRWRSGDRVTASCRHPTTGSVRTRVGRGRDALVRLAAGVWRRASSRAISVPGAARGRWPQRRGRGSRCRRLRYLAGNRSPCRNPGNRPLHPRI